MPSPAFIACRLLDRSHADWSEMVPHCGFDLHLSDNEWWSFTFDFTGFLLGMIKLLIQLNRCSLGATGRTWNLQQWGQQEQLLGKLWWDVSLCLWTSFFYLAKLFLNGWCNFCDTYLNCFEGTQKIPHRYSLLKAKNHFSNCSQHFTIYLYCEILFLYQGFLSLDGLTAQLALW